MTTRLMHKLVQAADTIFQDMTDEMLPKDVGNLFWQFAKSKILDDTTKKIKVRDFVYDWILKLDNDTYREKFNINLEAVLLDKNNAEVEFAEGSGILNILGSHDGSPVNTDLEMMFAEKKGASVTEVGAVGLVFTLQSAADGARLGPDSYVKAELQALAPKGVSADLKDYINKE